MSRRGGEQLVDEAILAASQTLRIKAGGGKEIVGISASRVWRGKDDRYGLTCRLKHHNRGLDRYCRDNRNIHSRIEAGMASAVTSQACLPRR